ncbi:hypothetical protein [Streptomyces rubiginosohelvolus]|uniref:hypothetical protein n=1 Tax=Streptomyces rubiginosohelvolus TaxID=67362 RepID=UPI00167B7E0A|nr:hypothetical protein [Streptomyces pluricolorescens]
MPTNRSLRTELQAAASLLHDGGDLELAQAVKQVLLPGGWKELRDTDEVGKDTNMPIRIEQRYRDAVMKAADQRVTITSIVNEGFEKYLAGEFTPRPRVQGRRATGEKVVNLNVRPNAALHGQVRESGVLPMHVAHDYLLFRFKVGPYAEGYTEPLPSGSDRVPMVPRAVRDLIRDRAAAAGRLVHDDMNEGFQRYLAGEFQPVAPEWPAGVEMAPLKVRPNNDLFDEVKVAARSASPELRPMQIGLAYVLEKYGIDPAATS